MIKEPGKEVNYGENNRNKNWNRGPGKQFFPKEKRDAMTSH